MGVTTHDICGVTPVDSGHVADDVRRRVPTGVDGVLELVGTVTLLDSLRAVPGGIVCNTGILGNAWVLERFEPLEDIPSTVSSRCITAGAPRRIEVPPRCKR